MKSLKNLHARYRVRYDIENKEKDDIASDADASSDEENLHSKKACLHKNIILKK